MYEHGKWLVHCDRCGFERKNDQVVKTWDNFWVCAPITGKTCFETRHPQDFLRSKKDDQSVMVRKQPATDTYRSVSVVAGSVGVQETTIPTGTFDNSL